MINMVEREPCPALVWAEHYFFEWGAKMERRATTTQAGLRIFYDCLEAAECLQTVVLVASTGRGGQDFYHLSHALAARGFKAIAPYPRGTAGSEGPLENINFHDLAGDIAEVIRAEGGPAIIVGHAYGNWIARTLAADSPELVKGVVLLAAASGPWPDSLSAAIDILLSPDTSPAERLEALRLAFFAPDNDPQAWLGGWSKPLADAQRKARLRSERQRWWGGGHAPILDLIAAADPFRPPVSYLDFSKEFGDRVTVKVIEQASHALPDERPLDVADAIHEWARTL